MSDAELPNLSNLALDDEKTPPKSTKTIHSSPSLALICSRASEYKPPRHKPATHSTKFNSFLSWQKNATAASSSSFVIQLVKHPQFRSDHSTLRTVTYYLHRENEEGFQLVDSLPEGYRSANSFYNTKCACKNCGEGKGWFYELNEFVSAGSRPSEHHESSRSGVVAPRNTKDDGTGSEATKGPHWKFPAKE